MIRIHGIDDDDNSARGADIYERFVKVDADDIQHALEQVQDMLEDKEEIMAIEWVLS